MLCWINNGSSRPVIFKGKVYPVPTTTITSESNVHLFKRKWLLNSSGWYRGITASKNLSFLTKFLLLKHLSTAIIFSGNPEYKREKFSSKLSKKQPNNIKKTFSSSIIKDSRAVQNKGEEWGRQLWAPVFPSTHRKIFRSDRPDRVNGKPS